MFIALLEVKNISFFLGLKSTVFARYLDVHKINNLSCNYLGSFFIEKLSLKKHLMNMKTAVHTTDPP